MPRSPHSYAKPRNGWQNLKKLDGSTSNNNSVSTSENPTTTPTLSSVVEKNRKIIYPSIQLTGYENKKSIIENEDDSSLLESSSYSDVDVKESFEKSASEPILNSRTTSTKGNKNRAPYVRPPIHFFQDMPVDIIRKILFEQFIDFEKIPETAKNLMDFASISKFNREFVRVLLTEERMHEVSFEASKLVIPVLLAKFANDKEAKCTQIYVDRLVHDWSYLTFDSSFNNTKFTKSGLTALKMIVCHSDLKEVRIINNLPEVIAKSDKNFLASNNIGLILLYSLLSRKSQNPIKVDFIFNNWVLPNKKSKFQLKDLTANLIEKIQGRAVTCESVIFGEIDLSHKVINYKNIYKPSKNKLNFIKMMCKVAVSHSAHTISLAGLSLKEEELVQILNEIQQCDNSYLQNLDLSRNCVKGYAVANLAEWLKSGKAKIENLILLDIINISFSDLDILADALKNNNCLKLVVLNLQLQEINSGKHPIRQDERVKYPDS